MNNRIQELAEQCGGTFTVCAMGCTSFDHEQFAELIIKECMAICMKNQFTGADNYNNGSISSAELIKEYFGVKK